MCRVLLGQGWASHFFTFILSSTSGWVQDEVLFDQGWVANLFLLLFFFFFARGCTGRLRLHVEGLIEGALFLLLLHSFSILTGLLVLIWSIRLPYLFIFLLSQSLLGQPQAHLGCPFLFLLSFFSSLLALVWSNGLGLGLPLFFFTPPFFILSYSPLIYASFRPLTSSLGWDLEFDWALF